MKEASFTMNCVDPRLLTRAAFGKEGGARVERLPTGRSLMEELRHALACFLHKRWKM